MLIIVVVGRAHRQIHRNQVTGGSDKGARTRYQQGYHGILLAGLL